MASRFNVAVEPLSGVEFPKRRQVWFVVMTASFVSGLICGITGLMLSLLTFAGALPNSRSLSLTVTAMIVAALGLMLFGAHAMDRMDEARRASGDDGGTHE